MTAALVRAVIAHYDSIFRGPNGDYPPLLETLEGLNAAQAAWKPGPDRNSIWQIVDHLTASNQWGVDMFEKGSGESPGWNEPEVNEENWQQALAALKSTQARLREAMAQYLSEDSLLAFPVPNHNQTLLELVLSTACAHQAYHVGQIGYIRGLQGI